MNATSVIPVNNPEHAFCSASGAADWMACPGRPAMNECEPDQPNEHSLLGVKAHKEAWEVLTRQRAITDLSDEVAAVGLYVGFIQGRIELYKKAGASVATYFEHKVPIGRITGEKFPDGTFATGTADCILMAFFPLDANGNGATVLD